MPDRQTSGPVNVVADRYCKGCTHTAVDCPFVGFVNRRYSNQTAVMFETNNRNIVVAGGGYQCNGSNYFKEDNPTAGFARVIN
jgi:hypothetical protein